MYISFGEFSKRQTVKCQGGFLKKGSLSIVGAGIQLECLSFIIL